MSVGFGQMCRREALGRARNMVHSCVAEDAMLHRRVDRFLSVVDEFREKSGKGAL